MKKHLALCFLLLLVVDYARSCSMFKITFGGKTMVGNNEDAWRKNSHIWFETGKDGHYGAVYVGHDDGFPQGGMNEAGLAYDGFTVYPRNLRPLAGREKIGNKIADKIGFLKAIMQQCVTVEDVQRFVSRYESIFRSAMLLFIDKKGDYLVVEADTTLLGHDSKYVLSNFCPSLTPDPSVVKIGRYQRGMAFLQNKQDSSLRFCTAMMDTMHECRPRLGDGTTYTTIYDLSAGLIYLYFYHDFTHCVSFDLRRELAKGDHILLMSSLFPPNAEYERFVRHKTPFNSIALVALMLVLGASLVVSVFWLLVLWIKKSGFLLPGLMLINICLVYYLYNLLTNKAIYYFSAPYKEEGRWMLNLTAYLPFVLLGLLACGLVWAIFRLRKGQGLGFLFGAQLICYAVLVGLFVYWGFYAIIM